jgi:predicted cobalt transporter CbtA
MNEPRKPLLYWIGLGTALSVILALAMIGLRITLWVFDMDDEIAPESKPVMIAPNPENVHAHVETVFERQFIIWVHCETRVVCFASEEGFDCIPESQLIGSATVKEACDDRPDPAR